MAVMIGAMILNPFTFLAVFALICALAVREFCLILNNSESISVSLPTPLLIAGSTYLMIANSMYLLSGNLPILVPYFLFLIYLLVQELYRKQENPLGNWACAMLTQLYIALPFALLTWIYTFYPIQHGYLLPLSIFVFLWMNDTGAYCVGSLIGKHRLFERISPKKSWEGFFGGLALASAAGFLMYKIDASLESIYNPYQWIGLSLVVAIFGTWGDLVESQLKRTLGMKDSGNFLPGHGGVLDRFDSALLAIPAAFCYLILLT